MKITLNGEERAVGAILTIEALLAELALDTAKIAVERNLHIVPRSAYGATQLCDGDSIEIVHFIGGG